MSVEIVPDQDWFVLTGAATEGEALRLTRARRAAVKALREGPITDPNGQATRELYRRMVRNGYDGGNPRSLTGVLREPAMATAIARDINGKRTMRIELVAVPERWAHLLNREQSAQDEPVTEPEPATPEPVTEPEPQGELTDSYLVDTEALRLDVAGSVATALLTRVIEIVSSPDSSKQAVLERDTALAERDDARTRLATALEYGQRMARENRQLGDDLAAVKHERDGLRKRLGQAEANIARMTAPNGATAQVVNDLVQAELAKVMRAAPAPGHGPPFPGS